jgi:hypothetical protein
MDDNGGDWTDLVSGANAASPGDPWDGTSSTTTWRSSTRLTLIAVMYQSRLMNICMALAVNPASGEVAVVGTDATNEVRFEPVVTGRFLRVNVALVDAGRRRDGDRDSERRTWTTPMRFLSCRDERALTIDRRSARHRLLRRRDARLHQRAWVRTTSSWCWISRHAGPRVRDHRSGRRTRPAWR